MPAIEAPQATSPPPQSMDSLPTDDAEVAYLKESLVTLTDKYELASMFAHCQARQSQLSDKDSNEFQHLLVRLCEIKTCQLLAILSTMR